MPHRRVRPELVFGMCAIVGLVGRAETAVAQLRASIYAVGFASPLEFVQSPSEPTVQYVIEQTGRIRIVQAGVLQATSFLDLSTRITSGGERGLLGLAFAPDYPTSRRFYVNFTDLSGNTVVARFKTGVNNLADPTSRFDLQWPTGQRFIAQPFANHNGGHLAFGPDGYLYIGMGDGGGGNDPNHQAQTPSSLLGKMLRIDVNVSDGDPKGYRIPSDNPFVGTTGLGETWAFGLRNPWKFSFDDPGRGGTGALVIADVGQSRWEEIDYEPRNRGGRNYGWRNREGAHDNVTSLPPAFLPLTDPIHEYDRSLGQSITGGYVYRGAMPVFQGRYFFADFVAARVWSVALTIDPSTGEARASGRIEHTAELGGAASIGNVSSFGVDAAGELYIVSYSLGRVLKIDAASPIPPAPTGLRIVLPGGD